MVLSIYVSSVIAKYMATLLPKDQRGHVCLAGRRDLLLDIERTMAEHPTLRPDPDWATQPKTEVRISIPIRELQGTCFHLTWRSVVIIERHVMQLVSQELHRRAVIYRENNEEVKQMIYDFMDDCGILEMPEVTFDSLKKRLQRFEAELPKNQ